MIGNSIIHHEWELTMACVFLLLLIRSSGPDIAEKREKISVSWYVRCRFHSCEISPTPQRTHQISPPPPAASFTSSTHPTIESSNSPTHLRRVDRWLSLRDLQQQKMEDENENENENEIFFFPFWKSKFCSDSSSFCLALVLGEALSVVFGFGGRSGRRARWFLFFFGFLLVSFSVFPPSPAKVLHSPISFLSKKRKFIFNEEDTWSHTFWRLDWILPCM